MAVQIYDGEDGFSQVEVRKPRAPFHPVCCTRMQQYVQTKDPENVCQRNTEVLSTPLPFDRTLLVSTFSSPLLGTWEAGLARLTWQAHKKA